MTHQPGLSKREQASAVMQLRSAQGSGPKVLLLHSFVGAKFTELTRTSQHQPSKNDTQAN